MQWLNLRLADFGRREFLKADERQRGIWLSLLAYCATQENSGIIDNCAAWSDREWLQICGVSKKIVLKGAPLWRWLDGSLIVELYPIDMQNKTQNLRSRAEAGAQARWHAKRHEQAMPVGINEHMPTDACRNQQADAEGEGERKGNRKGREGEGEMPPAQDLSGLASPPTTQVNRDRLRFLLERHGSKLDMAGVPIFHEWVTVCQGYNVAWLEKIFNEVQQVPLPSDMRRILKKREHGYAAWRNAQKQETERISKESA